MFPSRSALLAELQREATDNLSVSFSAHRDNVDAEIATRGLGEPLAALLRVVGATWFWIDAGEVFPRQVEITRQMYTDPSVYLKDEDAARVLPIAMRLFERARLLAAEAADAGALEGGSGDARAVIVVAGTTGVLLTSGLSRWDPELFNGVSLAREMARALFLGWGADPSQLSEVEALLESLAADGRLVPELAASQASPKTV